MIPYRIKQVVFALVTPLTYMNLLRKRSLLRKWQTKTNERLVLHLGCGKKRLGGFCNIDANPLRRPDLTVDLRIGLPFPAGSVDAIYSHHVFEMFSLSELRKVLAHCFTVLKDGGGMRVGTPSLDRAIDAYVRGDTTFFRDWPDEFRSIGGRFVNYLLCRDQHRLMFDFSFMAELLEEAGFVGAVRSNCGASQVLIPAESVSLEGVEDASSLFVEAFKE